MKWYTCGTCNHQFNSGFSRIKYCPKCWKKSTQIGKVFKRVILFAIFVVGPIIALVHFIPDIGNRVKTTSYAALDTRMLFGYSKDAYLESIIRGRLTENYYTTRSEKKYYTSILPHARVETTEPAGTIPANVVVDLQSVIRRGEHVWIPASFYKGEKIHHAFILFPRDWEDTVRTFDKEKRVTAIKEQYERTIRRNFELKEVKPADETDFQERYNDYFKVREIMKGENCFYAPKKDKYLIDKAYSYFLNPKNIDMVILQTDKEWVRPELDLTRAEETK